jgi:hypothetical protein
MLRSIARQSRAIVLLFSCAERWFTNRRENTHSIPEQLSQVEDVIVEIKPVVIDKTNYQPYETPVEQRQCPKVADMATN